jgi:hypothetical protein
MEHSGEYYKMKYFKYKAKYTKEKQAQQSGGIFMPTLSKSSESKSNIPTFLGITFDRAGAKNEIFKKAFDFYIKNRTINNNNLSEDKEKEEWNKITKYSQVKEKLDELKLEGKYNNKELREIKENLKKWCEINYYILLFIYENLNIIHDEKNSFIDDNDSTNFAIITTLYNFLNTNIKCKKISVWE